MFERYYTHRSNPTNLRITTMVQFLLSVHTDLISNCNQRAVFQRLNFRSKVFEKFPRQLHCSMSVLSTVIFR